MTAGTMTKRMFNYPTSIGLIGIAEEGSSITDLWFQKERAPTDAIEQETDLLSEANGQLTEYLSRKRRVFNVPLAPAGTPFQQRVWGVLLSIHYGQTKSYGEIADRIGSPGASRAVGGANHRNPLPIFVPCHRVVGAKGKLTGYLGGLEIKERLLDLERRNAHGP